MKALLAIPLLAVLLALASCEIRGNAKATKTPPVPTAAAVPPPAPPAPPISTPQTEIQLPEAQPVTPEALATIQVPPAEPKPPEPPPEPTAKPTTRRPAPAPQPKQETPPAVAETPPPQPAAPAEEQPRLQPFYSEEERRRILGEIEKRRVEIEGILHGINQRRLAASKRSVIGRIHSFIEVADDAARRGDLRSADSLSQRALILAQELAGGR